MPVRICYLTVLLFISGSYCSAEPTKKDEPKLELSDDEKTILALTNQAREAAKLPPLKANPILFKVARQHSQNMAKKGEMKHELDDKNPAKRAEAAGYDYKAVAENIATSTHRDVEAVFKGWMSSEHHKENILGDSYQEIGIGLATNDKGEVYYTQVFGTQRKKKRADN
jgi:uncharacterized protein YkwD